MVKSHHRGEPLKEAARADTPQPSSTHLARLLHAQWLPRGVGPASTEPKGLSTAIVGKMTPSPPRLPKSPCQQHGCSA